MSQHLNHLGSEVFAKMSKLELKFFFLMGSQFKGPVKGDIPKGDFPINLGP